MNAKEAKMEITSKDWKELKDIGERLLPNPTNEQVARIIQTAVIKTKSDFDKEWNTFFTIPYTTYLNCETLTNIKHLDPYFSYVCKNSSEVGWFSGIVTQQILNNNYSSAVRAINKRDTKKTRYIFYALENSHFWVYHVDFATRRIEAYNSLHAVSTDTSNKQVLTFFNEYYKIQNAWELHVIPCPQQKDMTSCGIFSCMIAKTLVNDGLVCLIDPNRILNYKYEVILYSSLQLVADNDDPVLVKGMKKKKNGKDEIPDDVTQDDIFTTTSNSQMTLEKFQTFTKAQKQKFIKHQFPDVQLSVSKYEQMLPSKQKVSLNDFYKRMSDF